MLRFLILCILLAGCSRIEHSRPEVIIEGARSIDVAPYIINFMAKRGYVLTKKNTIMTDYILRFEKPLSLLQGVAKSIIAEGAYNLILNKSKFNLYKITADDREVVVFSLTKLGDGLHIVVVTEMIMGSGLRLIKYAPTKSQEIQRLLQEVADVFNKD